MKKFTKIMLIIAGVLATIGVSCMLVAFAMGLTTGHFIQMIRDGRFSFDGGDIHISFDQDEGDDLGDEILGDEVKSECSSMEIEFGAGLLSVSYGDVECIQVKQKNISNLKVSVKDGILMIKEGSGINVSVNELEDRRLEIILPQNTQFDKVEMEIGASKADISKLVAKELRLEVGAGQATVKELTVDKLDVEAGLGQVDIEMSGAAEEYNYDIECGIGRVVVGSDSYSGLGAEKSVKHENATKEIDVECGIGEVKIQFEK